MSAPKTLVGLYLDERMARKHPDFGTTPSQVPMKIKHGGWGRDSSSPIVLSD
jgi:hypothetical protein